MTRTEYLSQLELYLKKLPEADRVEAMDYFRELFDDAGVEGEEELIASLGTPKEAAHEVLANLLDKKINEAPAQKNNRQILHIALLALLAAPSAFLWESHSLCPCSHSLWLLRLSFWLSLRFLYLVSSADSYF